MARSYFSKGAKGDIIRRVQKQLAELGHYAKAIDGDYGKGTVAAVTAFQKKRTLPQTGEIDDTTWTELMGVPIPSVDDRCLGLTAAFEGHGFTLAQGNFDKAGVTWGIIGFTLVGGELKTIFKQALAEDEAAVRACFGDNLDILLDVFEKPADEQRTWADSISIPPSKAGLLEPWLSAFAQFGETELGQRIQLDRVNNRYQKKARSIKDTYGLKTELGHALAFDIAVQNGSVNTNAAAQIDRNLKAKMSQRQKREVIAQAVGDNAKNIPFRDDVRTRKLTIARGEGDVHGAHYVLRKWGLED